MFSALCALAAFLGVLAFVDDVDAKVGPQVTAYQAKEDIAAYRTLDPGQFTTVAMPRRWLPATAVTDLRRVTGRIAAVPLRKGSLLQADMVADQPALAPGQQELAIMIDAATGVPGEIHPGDSVNIYATFPGNQQQGGRNESRIIVTGARVLKIGRQTPISQTSDQTDARATRQAVPVAFALTTLDAQRVAYAESFATHVRLALTAPGSPAPVPSAERTYTLEGDR
ncbi:hypothetical protein SCATT_38620 [Streptantibioticus cattleyicolor NRRL 8057 = DSM 46488]|uniref:SAF domain-containing protein n=1 Tax=Streptantibioticus cattleyicolor (strain ATCC 35852 / DSM 46488 / JCM 4925 / NBRC 14057 / NRRL 8057) TaxID=1003195 RepID=G8WR76_STREN|nr:hypothetical protein SCATT_38620 [Streptantibioticus cattleyicolor NRRL 8057 = DSM 46488]